MKRVLIRQVNRKAQVNLCAVLLEPSLFAHTIYGTSGAQTHLKDHSSHNAKVPFLMSWLIYLR